MKKNIFVVILFVLPFLSGCLVTEDTYLLNPDGSGQVVHHVVFDMNNVFAPQEWKKRSNSSLADVITKELQLAAGVEAWKDVSYTRDDNGKIEFQAVAFFPDISKIKFYNNGLLLDIFKIEFAQDPSGKTVLTLGKNLSQGDKKPVSDIEQKVKAVKDMYSGPLLYLPSLFNSFQHRIRIYLPGEIQSVTNFVQESDNSVVFELSGSRLNKIRNQTIEKDEWIKDQIQNGKDLRVDVPLWKDDLNDMLFTEKGPIRVIISGKTSNLFEYKTEMSKAKEAEKLIFKELKQFKEKEALEAHQPLPELMVGGMRLIHFEDSGQGINPFGANKGYSLSLVMTLPEEAHIVAGGFIEEIVADNDESLLADNEWKNRISDAQLTKDRKAAVFNIFLKVPGKDVRGIKKIKGRLDFIVVGSPRTVDLGFSDLTEGTRAREYDSVIRSRGESRVKGYQELALSILLPREAIKSLQLSDNFGRQSKLDPKETFGSNDRTTFIFLREEEFPKTGTILAEVYDDFKKLSIHFEIYDLTLFGMPQEGALKFKKDIKRDYTIKSPAAERPEVSTYLNKEEAVAIAEQHAKGELMDLSQYNVSKAKFRTAEGRWIVYFKQVTGTKGGWFNIIIEDKTGQVIEMQRGKQEGRHGN